MQVSFLLLMCWLPSLTTASEGNEVSYRHTFWVACFEVLILVARMYSLNGAVSLLFFRRVRSEWKQHERLRDPSDFSTSEYTCVSTVNKRKQKKHRTLQETKKVVDKVKRRKNDHFSFVLPNLRNFFGYLRFGCLSTDLDEILTIDVKLNFERTRSLKKSL